jgi:hypothetical protein
MDKKAKEILFKTYWSGAGWIDDPQIARRIFYTQKKRA